MQKLFITITLLSLSLFSCGSDRDAGGETPLPQVETLGLQGKWQLPDDGQTVLDFSVLTFDEERSSEEILYTCDHWTWGNRARDYTNSGTAPGQELEGLSPGTQRSLYKITGTAKSGSLRIGYLRNSRFPNDICRIMSGERYDFSVSGNTLSLKMVAPGKSWDGSVLTATRIAP